MKGRYEFEQNAVDSMNNDNGTNTGSIKNVTDSKVGSYAYNYTGGNTLIDDDLSGTKWSVAFWVKRTALAQSGFIYGRDTDDVDIYFSTTQLKVYSNAGANQVIRTVNDLDWHHVVITYNAGTLTAYFDNQTNYTGAQSVTAWAATDTVRIGDNTAQSNALEAQLDQLIIWNRTITAAEVSTLWNDSNGYSFVSPPSTDSFNITDTDPSNNTQFNTQLLGINITADAANLFHCTLYINGTINQTVNNISAGKGVKTTFNVSFAADDESAYTYHFYCWDGVSPENTSIQTFYIDNVLPNIAWFVPWTNSSYFVLNTTFQTNINVTDPNLYSYQYNISYSHNKSVVYSFNNTNLTGLTTYNINHTVNMSGYSGKFNATVRVCDGHTNKEIRFDKVTNYNDELGFDSVKIYLENKADTISLKSEKKKDRYEFDFSTKTKTKTKSFIVESAKPIKILHGKTPYQGHLVTGEKWIDFEMNGAVWVENVEITRLNDKKVKVTITTSTATDSWHFNSIGELNCDEETKQFYVASVYDKYSSYTLTRDDKQFYLNFSSYNASFMSLAASLVYEGTAYPATGSLIGSNYVFNSSIRIPLISSDTNLSFYWNYTINGVKYNFTNRTQEVYMPRIDNCSAYNTDFANFTILDEETGAITKAILTYDFDYWINDYSNSFTGSMTNKTPFIFCMYPRWAVFNTNISMDYQLLATSTTSRSYNNNSFLVDNVTDKVNLLILSNPTDITIHVINNEDDDLANVLIEAYKYDVATSSDTLVESQYTDSAGNAIFGLKLGTTRYSFRFYQDGVLKLNTTRFKLFATSYEYVIDDTEISRIADWLILDNGMDWDLTYTNATKRINFTWQDSTYNLAGKYCLNVTDYNKTYYSACSIYNTSSLAYTITTLNVSYIAEAYVISSQGNRFTLEFLGIDTREGWRNLGTNISIILSLIIFLTIGMLGLVNKNLAVVMSGAALLMLYMFGVMPLSWVGLVGVLSLAAIILVVINRT